MFLEFALDRGDWPGCCTLQLKSHNTNYTGMWVGPWDWSECGGGEKDSCPCQELNPGSPACSQVTANSHPGSGAKLLYKELKIV